ncbi:MAG: hypothetical protein QOI21_2881 [Actinomycetota bacterium]|jgi:ketosteroid isomerase-like protein|nr:hypothetical protein [Actinomycetota bacterium]
MEFAPDIPQFVARYAAVWNEPDPEVRHKAVAELWADDGVEVNESAEYCGHAAIETRITKAYEEFVEAAKFAFKPVDGVVAHHNAVTFTIVMVPAAGGDIAWTGSIFVLFGDDRRIQRDYQFAVNTPPDASTRTTAEEFLCRLGDGDPDRVAELFAETVDWRLDWPVEGHPAVPWIRPRSTRADVADHFRTLNEFHVPGKQGGAAPEIVVDGTAAVVLADIRQTVRATGRSYVARCALRLTVEDGLITRYHVYEDSLTVAQALAGS